MRYADEAATPKSAIFWLPEGRANSVKLLRCFVANDTSGIKFAPRALKLG